jgi:predicted metal-dependent phosphoesterase TrpH
VSPGTGTAAERDPFVRSFADLHCHSSASFDSLNPPSRLVRAAHRVGLTHLAITDHERIDGALRARDDAAAAGDGLTVIVGEEIRTTDGDLLGLFLEHRVPAGLSLAETAAAIHDQGGLVGLPHPFDRFRSSGGHGAEASGNLETMAAALDFVEVHNARALGRANERAADLAQQAGLPGVAASDAHTLLEVGVAYTVLPGTFTTAGELLTLLPNASLVLGRAAYVTRLLTPLAKLVQRVRGNARHLPVAARSSHP